MDFQHPWFLLLLIILPVSLFYYQKYGKNREGTILFSSERYFSDKVKSRGRLRNRWIKLFEVPLINSPAGIKTIVDSFPCRLSVKSTGNIKMDAARFSIFNFKICFFYLSSFLFDFGKFFEEPEILKKPRNIAIPITI